MTPHLGRNSTEICLIIIYVLDYIYNRFNHFLFFEPRYFTAEKPGIILQLNSSEGSPTAELFWIYCWNSFPSKDKSKHCLQRLQASARYEVSKFRSNERIGNLSGPCEGKRHNGTMLTNLLRSPLWTAYKYTEISMA